MEFMKKKEVLKLLYKADSYILITNNGDRGRMAGREVSLPFLNSAIEALEVIRANAYQTDEGVLKYEERELHSEGDPCDRTADPDAH